jgi:hypothetical protein
MTAALTSGVWIRSKVTSLAPAGLPDGLLYVHLGLDVTDSAGIPGLRYPAPAPLAAV